MDVDKYTSYLILQLEALDTSCIFNDKGHLAKMKIAMSEKH